MFDGRCVGHSVGVPKCSRAAIGRRAAGLYIVERALRLSRPPASACGRRCYVARVGRAGCSYRLESDVFRRATPTSSRPARSTRPADRPAAADRGRRPSEADLAYARAAAADALARGDKDSSVPWENPQTGAGGNITPLAAAYSEGGLPCRDFLASYVRGESQAWLQGAACRTGHGKWEVKSLKPLKRLIGLS